MRAAGSQILRVTSGSREARLEGGQTAACRAENVHVVCDVGGARIDGPVVEVGGGGPVAEFLLVIPGKIERRFRGRLVLTLDEPALRAVVVMDRETAVSSITAAESPPDAAFEALKAQAVAARSYLEAGPRHRGFDFCDTTHCQFLRAAPAESAPATLAAAATEGLLLAHEDKIVRALYSRSCGGTTRTLSEAGLAAEGYPYYRVVCDSCRRSPETWRATFDRAVIEPLLRQPTEAARITLARQAGWSSLPSTRFRAESGAGSVTLHGEGVGHGIGLCQRGAASMAATGADFATILRHYFPNTRLGTAAGH